MYYPLVIGNWKLHGNKKVIKDFVIKLRYKSSNCVKCQIVFSPPVIYLDLSQRYLGDSKIQLGAQNVDIHTSGAFTGEISAKMLKDMGAKYVIIGHSERRMYHKETNEFIAEKFSVLKEEDLIPILCIGENLIEKRNKKTKIACEKQIDAIIKILGVKSFKDTIIAYEPIWAIGTGMAATPDQVQEVHEHIRNHIAYHNLSIAKNVVIQYGGSVNLENSCNFLMKKDINGLLVGSASLEVEHLIGIAKNSENVIKEK